VKPWLPAPASRALGWAGALAACVAYAVLTHQAASEPHPGLYEAAVIVVPLLALAPLLVWQSATRAGTRAAWLGLWLMACVAAFAMRDWLVFNHNWVLLLQQVTINGLLGIAFGRTLADGQVPLIARFAALVHGTLSPRVARYTRQVTWAWTLYFALTIVVSLLLFWLAPVAAWSVFVNLLSAPLLVAMFAAEYLVRLCFIPREERGGFLEAVRAYRTWAAARAARAAMPDARRDAS
jgi:uncharacterized membrane protein